MHIRWRVGAGGSDGGNSGIEVFSFTAGILAYCFGTSNRRFCCGAGNFPAKAARLSGLAGAFWSRRCWATARAMISSLFGVAVRGKGAGEGFGAGVFIDQPLGMFGGNIHQMGEMRDRLAVDIVGMDVASTRSDIDALSKRPRCWSWCVANVMRQSFNAARRFGESDDPSITRRDADCQFGR